MAKTSPRQLRIIAGQWRSRKFQFPDIAAIRPTSDKLRETLFNWLQFDVHNMHCLDLFAGSGALGLEALSRGAAQVDFVDSHHKITQALRQHLQQLDCNQATVHTCTAQKFIQKNTKPFDLIFLDPPFHTILLTDTLTQLLMRNSLHKNSLIFIETEQDDFVFPKQLNVQKHSQSGQSHGWLVSLA